MFRDGKLGAQEREERVGGTRVINREGGLSSKEVPSLTKNVVVCVTGRVSYSYHSFWGQMTFWNRKGGG